MFTIPRGEYYMVADGVWIAAGMSIEVDEGSLTEFLCIGCLERRLGRQLAPTDFTDCPLNMFNHDLKSPRLRSRLGV